MRFSAAADLQRRIPHGEQLQADLQERIPPQGTAITKNVTGISLGEQPFQKMPTFNKKRKIIKKYSFFYTLLSTFAAIYLQDVIKQEVFR